MAPKVWRLGPSSDHSNTDCTKCLLSARPWERPPGLNVFTEHPVGQTPLDRAPGLFHSPLKTHNRAKMALWFMGLTLQTKADPEQGMQVSGGAGVWTGLGPEATWAVHTQKVAVEWGGGFPLHQQVFKTPASWATCSCHVPMG